MQRAILNCSLTHVPLPTHLYPATPKRLTRTYALSRHRDRGVKGRPARHSLRASDRVPGGARESQSDSGGTRSASNASSSYASNAQSVVPSSPTTASSSTPSRNWLGNFDSYQPVGPVDEDVHDVGPPPVAPGDLIQLDDAAAAILSHPSLVVIRQLEMMNVFLGFEQANRYRLVNTKGEDVGYLAETEGGFASSIGRQIMRNHRPFSCSVLDTSGNVVLRVARPFSIINSRISVSKGADDPSSDNKIGECVQVWHPIKRKYELYQRYRAEDPATYPIADATSKAIVPRTASSDEGYTQFANIDARMLAWDFYLHDENGQVLASVNRNFMGFGREIFTDTGQYVLRFDQGVAESEIRARLDKGAGINPEIKEAVEEQERAAMTSPKEVVKVDEASPRGLTLDQRAVLLAMAMTIDVDYFSRTNGGGMHMPFLWMPMPGGGGTAEAPVPSAGGEVPVGTGPPGEVSAGEAPSSPTPTPDNENYEFGDYGTGNSGGDYSFGTPDDSGLSDGEAMQDPWGQSSSQGDSGGGGSWWDSIDIGGGE